MFRNHISVANIVLRLCSILSTLAALLGLSIKSAVADIDWNGPPVSADGLRVGSELLNWGSEGNIRVLTHGGRAVVSTTNSYVSPAFTILDTWNNSDTRAVLLQAGVTATKDCSIIYVVENRQPRMVSAHDLGMICVGFDAVQVERNEQGFRLSYAPTPTSKATARQWRARTGDVAKSEIEFRPEPGTTMAKLVATGRPELTEPLQNEEFFLAVSRIPKPYRDRLLAALWQVTNGCSGCGGSAHQQLYGAAIDARTAAYSGCGWYMEGARVNCGQSDALAVWDRERGGFYLALDVHQKTGMHNDAATLKVWPALWDWPPAARERFEAWQEGISLSTTNR